MANNFFNTTIDLPDERSTFVLETLRENIMEYLCRNDLLNATLASKAWYCLVKESDKTVIRIMDWKKNKFTFITKYHGQEIFVIEYMLIRELKFSMLESRNLYQMKSIMEKIFESQLYIDCAFCPHRRRNVAEEIYLLQKQIITDVTKLEGILLKCSMKKQNSFSEVREKFLNELLGEKT